MEKDVHTRHCRKQCGCKYGDDKEEDLFEDGVPFVACSVVSGRKEQENECGKQCPCVHSPDSSISAKSETMLLRGIESGKTESAVYLGKFSKP